MKVTCGAEEEIWDDGDFWVVADTDRALFSSLGFVAEAGKGTSFRR